MKRRHEHLRRLASVLGVALLYVVFDAPIRLTGFLSFGSFVGIKCLLPVLCGLLLGPLGGLGCAIGAGITGLTIGSTFWDGCFECFSCLFVASALWGLWHAFEHSGRVDLKTPRKLALYVLSVLGVSAACGGIGLLCFGDWAYFMPVLVAYGSVGILVGVPVLTVAVSIVCVDTCNPRFRRRENDVEFTLHQESDLMEINDLVDECAVRKQLPMKRGFEIESCIEESVVRILSNEPGVEIAISAYLSDSLSLKMRYRGQRFNPIQKQENDDRDSLIGLEMIRAQALRVSFAYRDGVNDLHIVL